MQPKTLRFRAAGTALVQDYEALDAGIRKYVGRKAVPLEDGSGRLSWPEDGVAEVPYRADYVAACIAGDLEAADEETAKACAVLWPRDLAPGERLEDAATSGSKKKGA